MATTNESKEDSSEASHPSESSQDSSKPPNTQPDVAPLHLSPVSLTSSNSMAPGPSISPHSPATTAVEPTQAEASLIRPSEGPLIAPSAPTPRRTTATPSMSNLAREVSDYDYFSPASRFPSAASTSTQDSVKQGPLPAGTVSDADKFVEAAREELYGNFGTIKLDDQTNSAGDPAPNTAHRAELSNLSRTTTQRTTPIRSKTEHPNYPNQSLAALHTQLSHPRSATSHSSNTRFPSSSQPGLFSPSGTLLPRHRLSDQTSYQSLSPRTSRTAGNTPVQTPGLFPSTHPHHFPIQPFALEGTLDELSEGSLQTSPYLHPSQQLPPRTVTSAERQVDTFSGRKLINHYEIYDELGRGVHGKVKLARDLDSGADVAIKIVSRYSKRTRLGKLGKSEDKVKREVAILKKIRHPNVVRLIEVIDDPDIAKVYLVLEFCELKEVNWRHTGYPEIILAEHYRQLAEYQGEPREEQDTPWNKITAERRRRRQREARRAPRRRRTTSSAEEQDSHMWSLEYGGETDEESYSPSEAGASELMKEPSSEAKAAEKTHSTEPSGLELQRQKTSGSSVSYDTRPFSSPVASDTRIAELGSELQKKALASTNALNARNSETSLAHPESSYTDGFSFYSTEWYQADPQTLSGPTIDQIRKVGRGSVTGSSISAFTDNYESEVPEEYRYVPTMSLPECRTTFRDALVGIEYLHYHGVVHRDIKPENLLRNRDRRVKISDFGVSYLGKPVHKAEDSGDVSEVETNDFDEETALAKTVGTPAFYAPELCNLDPDSDSPVVTGQIDLWALGVTLFCLLFARTPFTAENQFVLMRKIWEDEIFIPRLRLKAVNPLLRSPGPQGALYAPDKRLPDQWLHEPIDDELYDLLKKLFEKNPKDRITIRDLKHHPWVLRGLINPTEWLRETDPIHFGFGEKIEPSKEEVAEAVIPIKIVERIRSLTKRASSALGLSARRKRGQSSAASSEGGSGSTQDGANQEVRRLSLQSGDPISGGSKSSREKEAHEHPLATSLTASPTSETKDEFGEVTLSPASPTISPTGPVLPTSSVAGTRPGMPDRQISEMSTTGSIRTIRQADVDRGRLSSVSPPSAEISDKSETNLEAPAPSSLRAIFGNAGRSILRTVSRDGASSSASSHKSSSPEPGKRNKSIRREPSAAVANTATSSLLGTSIPGKSGPQENPRSSPSISKNPSAQDVASATDVPASSTPSGTGQATPSLQDHNGRHHLSAVDFGGGMSRGTHAYTAHAGEPTDEEYRRAIDDLNRRRNLEDLQTQERLNASRPQSSYAQEACPPSPDDESPPQPQPKDAQTSNYFVSNFSPSSTAFSSEDHLVSDQSRSTSYPSIPSALSADSSEVSDPLSNEITKAEDSSSSSEGTAHAYVDTPTYPMSQTCGPGPESDDGYAGDGDGNGEELSAVAEDSDNDDSSDSDEDFLLLSRRKSKASARGSINRDNSVKESSQDPIKKTERSGSTNTMRKVIPEHGVPDEDHL